MSKAGKRANRAKNLRRVAAVYAKRYHAHTGQEATPKALQALVVDCQDCEQLRLALGLALSMMGVFATEAK